MVGQALTTTFAVFGGMIDVPWRVESGAIVVDLARPFGFLRWWLAREIGRAAVFAVSRAVPAGLVGAALFGVRPPGSAAAALGFAASLPLALLAGFGIRYLVALTAFWITDVRGALAASSLALMFFSGAVLPLTIFDHGRLGFDGDLATLRGRLGGDRTLIVDLATPLPALAVATPGVRVVRVDGPRQWLAFSATASAAPLIAEVAARYPVVDFSIREPALEDVITRLYSTGAVPAARQPAAPADQPTRPASGG